jgi:hypothetical protein
LGGVSRDYEFTDLGKDQVLADCHIVGRGRTSGVEVEMAFAQLWRTRNGKSVYQEFSVSRAEALEAARSA